MSIPQLKPVPQPEGLRGYTCGEWNVHSYYRLALIGAGAVVFAVLTFGGVDFGLLGGAGRVGEPDFAGTEVAAGETDLPGIDGTECNESAALLSALGGLRILSGWK